MKKYMFPLALMILLATLAIPALLRADPLIESGYDSSGAYVEQIVDNPHGLPADTFASALTPTPPERQPAANPAWRVALLPQMSESHHSVRLVFAREFGSFADLAPAPRETAVALVAELADGEGAVIPPEPDNRGPVRRTWDAIANGYTETPIRATFATIGTAALGYWLYDKQLGGSGGGGASTEAPAPTGSPNANINGDGNVVLFNIITNPSPIALPAATEEPIAP